MWLLLCLVGLHLPCDGWFDVTGGLLLRGPEAHTGLTISKPLTGPPLRLLFWVDISRPLGGLHPRWWWHLLRLWLLWTLSWPWLGLLSWGRWSLLQLLFLPWTLSRPRLGLLSPVIGGA